MKYWTTFYLDMDNNDVVETLSEDEIIEEYYPYWSGKMIEKFGQEEFDKSWTKADCIDDWVVVNWAVEAKNE